MVSLDAFYGKAQILFNVNFSIEEGETVALIGRNGVGKTTLLKSIMNIEVFKRGKVIWLGEDITSKPTYLIASKGIAYMPDYTGLIPGISVLDNFRLAAGKTNPDLEFAKTIYPEIVNLLGRRADSLSGGERKIVGLLRALAMNPRLLLLDEPTEGVSPIVANRIYNIVSSLREKGLSILVVEQGTRFRMLEKIADRILVMTGGKLVFDSSTAQLEAVFDEIQRHLFI